MLSNENGSCEVTEKSSGRRRYVSGGSESVVKSVVELAGVWVDFLDTVKDMFFFLAMFFF